VAKAVNASPDAHPMAPMLTSPQSALAVETLIERAAAATPKRDRILFMMDFLQMFSLDAFARTNENRLTGFTFDTKASIATFYPAQTAFGPVLDLFGQVGSCCLALFSPGCQSQAQTSRLVMGRMMIVGQ
jgi:hypothetical protein